MKRPLCNGFKNRPKTIDNDVKEKYKTSPQACFARSCGGGFDDYSQSRQRGSGRNYIENRTENLTADSVKRSKRCSILAASSFVAKGLRRTIDARSDYGAAIFKADCFALLAVTKSFNCERSNCHLRIFQKPALIKQRLQKTYLPLRCQGHCDCYTLSSDYHRAIV